MFAFGSFAGFEAAALYAEETPDPTRSVPRATYAAVLVIGLFYLFTSWMMVGAVGAGKVQAAAAKDSGTFFLNLSAERLGEAASSVFGLLVITSIFASLLSGHNASARYLFALGRDRLLPFALGRVHAKHASPYVASLTQTAFTVLVVAVFAVGGLDPYRQLVTIMSGLSTLGIILLQTFASIAIVAFFRRRGDRRYGRTLVAPVLGCVGMLTATVLLLENFDTLADSHAVVINALPYAVLVVAVAAAGYALWLRRAHADRYAGMGNGAGEAAPSTRGEP
jgi:amino acid transporter